MNIVRIGVFSQGIQAKSPATCLYNMLGFVSAGVPKEASDMRNFKCLVERPPSYMKVQVLHKGCLKVIHSNKHFADMGR